MSTITALEVSNVFLNDWIIPFGISKELLSDNGPQFSRKFFAGLCSFLGTDLKTKNAYHPQKNGKTERDNKKIVSRLRNYVKEHQSYWDLLFSH